MRREQEDNSMAIAEWLIGSVLVLAVGSFLNVVIYRLPRQIQGLASAGSLWWPASCCPQCHVTLRWYDNVPLVSWVCLRGACRRCGERISLRYPLVELGTALLSGVLTWALPRDQLFHALLLSWALLALSLIDIKHQLLPDAITQPLLWFGLFLTATGTLNGSLHDAVLGVIAGYGCFTLLAKGFHYLRGYPGLGAGDAKLLAALGAWLGWTALPFVLLIASGSAILYVLISGFFWHRDRHQALPFGPWLSLAGLSLFIHSII